MEFKGQQQQPDCAREPAGVTQPAINQAAQKPTCNVRGLVAPNAMCSKIIVGGKYCGFSGDCHHKSKAEGGAA